MKIMLKDLRCGFAALFKPEAFGEGEPAYQLTLIVPDDHPAVALLDETVLAVATEKWKTATKAAAILKKIENDRKLMAWQKNEYTSDEGVPYDGFEGMFYIRGRNEVQPLLLGLNKKEVAKSDAGAPYAGCYVNVQVDIWAQDNQWGKGIRCKLLGVQFLRDGDAFAGGAKASAEDFDDLSDGAHDDSEFDDLA